VLEQLEHQMLGAAGLASYAKPPVTPLSHVSLNILVWLHSYLGHLPSNFIKLPASKRVLKIIL
jgi:hypothetical protein